MNHTDCPRFFSCNAALCPLDPAWRGVQHLPGERVCKYLLDSGKPGAAERYADDPTFAAVVAVKDAVCQKHRPIARAVENAAKTPFRDGNPDWVRRKPAIQADSD